MPHIKYTVNCCIFFAQVRLAFSSGGNPWAVDQVLKFSPRKSIMKEF